MKKATLFIAALITTAAFASGAQGDREPLKPYDFYMNVHQRVMQQMQNYRRDNGSVDYGYMAQFIDAEDPAKALRAFEPFREIARTSAVELAARNKMDGGEAAEIALRAVLAGDVLRNACEATNPKFKPEALKPDLFAPEFGAGYTQGSEFLENRPSRPQPVADSNVGKSAPQDSTEKVREAFRLPKSLPICPIGAELADTVSHPKSIEGIKNDVKSEVNKLAQPTKPAEPPPPTLPVPPAVKSAETNPVTRPLPFNEPTPLIPPIVNGVHPEPTKGANEVRGESPEEITVGGSASHRGVGLPTAESTPTAPSAKPEDRLSPNMVDSIIRQTLNDKLLTRDLDRRTADDLAERLSSAYKREGDLGAAFAQVQKEMANPSVAHPKETEETPRDGNARVNPLSGSPEAALLKEFAGASPLENKNENGKSAETGTPAATFVSNSVTGQIPAGVVPTSGAAALAAKTLLALNGKNALKSDPENKNAKPGQAGKGGDSLSDGKASGTGNENTGPGGALGTVVGNGKTERPTVQTVTARIQSFLESMSKAFKPRSVSGDALRGLASTHAAQEDTAHFEDETTLALASFGESSGEWSGAEIPNVWIPIGFFLGAFGVTLGVFLGWQRWRNRKPSHRS